MLVFPRLRFFVASQTIFVTTHPHARGVDENFKRDKTRACGFDSEVWLDQGKIAKTWNPANVACTNASLRNIEELGQK